MNASSVAAGWIGASLALALAWPAHGADDNLVGDETVVASLNQPPAGLSCDDAAAQASVYFQFVKPPFPVKQLSLYVDGHGVPQGDIDEHWPTVTLKRGLHPGRNTVDVVATGDSGQSFDRRLVVLVGLTPTAEDRTAAVIDCVGAALAQAQPQAVEPAPEGGVIEEQAPTVVAEEPPTVIEEGPTYDYDEGATVYYEEGPVYVYNPYPVVALAPWVPIIPFFSFAFFYDHYHPYCPPPAVAYHPYPPYYGGGHYGRYGGYPGGSYGGGGGNVARPTPPYGGGRGPHDPSGPRPYAAGGWHASAGIGVAARAPDDPLTRPYAAPAWRQAARPVFHPVEMRPPQRPPAEPPFHPSPQFHGFRAPAVPPIAFHGGGFNGGGHAAATAHGGGHASFKRR